VQGLTDRVWMRSREEEQGPVRVYRPEGYPFPPARGREGLAFNGDGTFAYIAPGRGDRPGREVGRWRSAPGDPARITAEVGGARIELNVLEVTDQVLRLEWVSP